MADPDDRRLHLAAVALIVGTALLRLAYLAWDCPLDLAPDEAHYWDWSRHLDWSYYSKGPLVALLIRASCELLGPLSVALTGSEMLAVRLPAVLCGALLLASAYVLTLQVHGGARLGLGVVVVGSTLPLVAAGSALMTIDAPFTCAWGWALVLGHRAVIRGSWWAWPAAGACVAVGLLAKHTMVLWVPCFALFLLATASVRPLLFTAGPWVLAAVGALGGLPILWWNVQNDWVTLKHTGGHAGVGEGVHWLGPLRYLGMQAAVLLGYWFVAWALAAWEQRPSREPRPGVRYLWWMSVPVVAFFLAFSLKNGGGEPNWPVAGYIAGLVLAAGWLGRALATTSGWRRGVLVGGVASFTLLGLVLTVLMHDTRLARPVLELLAGPPTAARPTPLRHLDPTCRLRGWRVLAAEVDRLREQLRAEGDEPVLAATTWVFPGELAFYAAGHPTVYCLGPALGERHSQYHLWRPNPLSDPDQFRGRTFLIVGAHLDLLTAFERVEVLRLVDYAEDGQPIATWPVMIGRDYRGFANTPSRSAY